MLGERSRRVVDDANRAEDRQASSTANIQAEPRWHRAGDPQQAAHAVTSLFSRHMGDQGEPEGIRSAPGRVNLIGEHLDCNGGPLLPLALPHSAVAAVRRRHDDLIRVVSTAELGSEAAVWEGVLADVGPGTPKGWPAYVAGVLWALRQPGQAVSGIDAGVVSTVPLGAGLSSSAVLECVIALAVVDLEARDDTSSDAVRAEVATACVRAENEVAGASTGGMYQAASLRCKPEHALLLDTADHSVQQVPFPLADHGWSLLVIDTCAPHRHAAPQEKPGRSRRRRGARAPAQRRP